MKRWMMAFLLVMLMLVGCTGGEDTARHTNFKQGTGELQLRFLDNAPPEKIYPESAFKLVVEARNLAAYDIPQGNVWITGALDKYFLIQPQEQDLVAGVAGAGVLQGRSITNPEGDVTLLEFSGRSGQLFQNAEQEMGTFFLKAGYHSTVEFTETVCLNPHLYAVYDAGCTVEVQQSYGGQGAPVAVTDLEQIMTPAPGAKVEFRATVANQGSGELKKLELQQARLGGEPILCVFQGTGDKGKSVDFTQRPEQGEEVVLICQQDLPDGASYSTPLFLQFAYDYETKQEHTLRLVR